MYFRQQFIAVVKAFPNEIINDDKDHSIPDFWTECGDNHMIDRIKSLRPEGKRDLYGLCSPTKLNETHFYYGIGIVRDEDTNVTGLDVLLADGYTLWETKPADYAVFKCFGSDADCLGETWSTRPAIRRQKTQTMRFNFERGEKNLFCELWAIYYNHFRHLRNKHNRLII